MGEARIAASTMIETPPPIGRTWRRLYTVVLLALTAEVALFYAFTRIFS